MGKLTFWKRISLTAAVGLVAACGGGSGGSGQTSLPVDLANNPPQIVGTPMGTALVGQLYRFTPSATDADGDTLTFRIENRPDWATFSPSTGRLEGTPPSTAQPVYQRILISVTDGKAFSELPAFDLTVQGGGGGGANVAPTISGTPATSVIAGSAYEFTPQAADPEGQPLTFTVTGRPAWATFDPATGRLSGTPGDSDVGTYSGIVITGVGWRGECVAAWLLDCSAGGAGGNRLGDDRVDAADQQHGQLAADEPGRLPDLLRYELGQPDAGARPAEPRHLERGRREPGRPAPGTSR